jgi:hypothetical protein
MCSHVRLVLTLGVEEKKVEVKLLNLIAVHIEYTHTVEVLKLSSTGCL